MDLRIPGPMRNLETLKQFVTEAVDLLCISVNWEYQFTEVCELVNSLPRGVFTVVGGKQATDFVEEVFQTVPESIWWSEARAKKPLPKSPGDWRRPISWEYRIATGQR